MNPVKPGYTTSEFWLTLLPNVALVVALFAPQLGVKLSDPTTINTIALIAAAVANIAYTVSRSRVKVAAAHPLAFAPVPSGPLPHANLNDEHPDVVKDWDAAKAKAAEAHGTKPAARVRKR